MKLLALLADGAVHSGEELAAALGVSRTAVWKHIERLRSLGLEVIALPRAGYRLEAPLELLDADRIGAHIELERRPRLARLELAFEVDSTNTRLLEGMRPPAGRALAMLAERQTAGRGRRGRSWSSPFGSALALSMSWCFEESPCDLSALSLAVGVGVVRALGRVGARGIALKWPNDIWFEDRKLGGILLEMRGEMAGPAFVVIGVGMNVSLAPQGLEGLLADAVAPAAVAEACACAPSRNALAGALIDELLEVLGTFDRSGFASFAAQWRGLDAMQGRRARVLLGEREFTGTALGIDEDGGLLLSVDGSVRKFVSGEASLRPALP